VEPYRPPHAEAFTILIVEDHPESLELMEAYLRTRYPLIVTATDGEAALAAVAELHPVLILLDIMLPRLDGFEVCRRLKADPATKSISIVMVTGLTGADNIERAVAAGADDFLTKPINGAELRLRVRSLLRLRHLQRELDETLDLMDHLQIEDGAIRPAPPDREGHADQ